MRHDESPHLAALDDATTSISDARYWLDQPGDRRDVSEVLQHFADAVESVIAAVRALADSPTAEPVEDIRGDVGQPDPEPCPHRAWAEIEGSCRHVAGHEGDCEPPLPGPNEGTLPREVVRDLISGARKAGALWALDELARRNGGHSARSSKLRADIAAGRVTP